ncbi:serine/threonine-protein kinase [Actinomadura sp. 7K507]|uniref:tetratricopeptide repeat protein n=1 Tax=Actinomadura sp. 7K507 TaxID=2530365 RepID=UPI0010491B3A|nr:serine/threonine-protein kinase [Actinomadura sp. 7K507]TDC91970.1 tetratricopeptide repeat protein [Actinomadura sp. 7K507]
MDTVDAEADYGRYVALGRAALAAGRFEEASRLLGEAVALRPDRAAAHVELAGALRGLGRTEMARRAYAHALSVEPSCSGAEAGLRGMLPGQQGRENFRVGQRLGSGRHIGHWTVLEVLRGGFGVVYVVRASDTGERKVLKTYDTRLLWSEADRTRFEREALTWVRLRPHRHIAPAAHVEWIEGLPCVVTEYAEGGDLAGLMADGALPPAKALRFARHLCDGLRHAHDQLGLVHRDVKPANCLLTEDYTLRVTDFGLARAFESDDAGLSGLDELPAEAGALYTTVAGTPRYMAPEQFVPGVVLDTRADVYAFGVVLFQMVTGVLPPANGRAKAYIDRTIDRRTRRTRLYQLVRACTDPDRENRPPDFVAVRELLDGVYREVLDRPAPAPPEPARLTAEGWVSRAVGLERLDRDDEALEAVEHGLQTAEQDGDSDVTRSKLWQVRGMALRGMDRPSEALAAYDRAVELNPDEPSAWLVRGNLLNYRLERREEALECYDRALRLRPDTSVTWGQKASTLGELERFEEAEDAAARALELDPRNKNILLSRAVLRIRQKRHTDALVDLDRALAIAPRFSDALYNKGITLLELSRPDEALGVLQLAAEIEPDDRDVCVTILRVAFDLGHYEQALEYWEKAHRQSGDTADLLVFKGLIQGNLHGRDEEELAYYERAIQLDPMRAWAWSQKAEALHVLDRLEEALPCYDRAVELNRGGVRAWNWKARALRELGRHEEALAWIDRAIDALPDDPTAWAQKGGTLIKLGHFEKALPCFERWRELDPTDVNAWLDTGWVLGQLDRHEAQLACYTEGLVIWPDDVRVWNGKAVALRELDRFEEAEQAYARTLELDPRNENNILGQALLRRRQNRQADALVDLDRALSVAPRYAPALLEKGCVLLALSRPADAMDALERAAEIEPDNRDVCWNILRAAFDLGRYERAMKCCVDLQRTGEDWCDLLVYKGLIHYRLHGRDAEELACYERAIELDPSVPEPWLNKADSLRELSRPDEALPCYNHAIELDPGLAMSWAKKSFALRAWDRHEEALTCADRALAAAEPDDFWTGWAWGQKGAALATLGQLDEALACYDESLKILPDSSWLWDGRRAVLERLSRTDEAAAADER